MDAVLVDSLVKPPLEPASVSRKGNKSTLAPPINKANAGDYARKATIARENNRKLRAAALNPANYIETRLSRVRAQLLKLDAMIDAELDPQKLDRLVCAQNRLSEQWRIFSGIPLPGSRRPGRESTTKRSGEVGPVE